MFPKLGPGFFFHNWVQDWDFGFSEPSHQTNSSNMLTRSGKKRAAPSAAPGNILNTIARQQRASAKRQCRDPELEPETDPRITLADPSIIPFRLLAPLLCPGWLALTRPTDSDGRCATDAATRADQARKCAPRMRWGCMLYKCGDCEYGPTRGYHWLLDPGAQVAVFEALRHHRGADVMQEMMRAMGSEASHLSIEYRDGFDNASLRGLLGTLNVLIAELWSFLDAIDAVKIAELVKMHRDKISSGVQVLGLVTDVAWDLITGSDPIKTRWSSLEYVPRVILGSGEDYRDLKQFQTSLRCLILEGYYASVSDGRGQSLMVALDAWSDTQDALKALCAFTSVCDDFISTLSYSKYVELKDSYQARLGSVVKAHVPNF